ncbi:hypothetical protein [Rhodanobacter sp. FW106-PBR-LB-2-11]|uniref:hypothetical protein n=1 Tax=Rhodanobacter sp. FW106-PBR-LB-2-11 TaxID=1524463 RepID=UPI0034E3BA81
MAADRFISPVVSRNREVMADAERFAAEHLRECCEEMLDFRATGVLRDGRVRALARLIHEVDAIHSLDIAQGLVRTAAMEAVAAAPPR